MNLSRFYKTNDKFKTRPVLDSSSSAAKEPVWESIVKKEEIPDDSINSDFSETEPTPTLPSEELSNDVIAEDDIADTQLEPPVEIPDPEPSIDIELIRENAFIAGIEAGRKQAEEDLENSAQTLHCICTELDRLRETILQNSSGEMKELVLAISEKIIRHSVTDQEKTIIATIKDAIHLAVTSDAFQIQINPDDLAAVEIHKQEIINSISGLDNITLKPDATIERGGCKLESECCTVDASMASQIKVIHDSVMAETTLSDAAVTEITIQTTYNRTIRILYDTFFRIH